MLICKLYFGLSQSAIGSSLHNGQQIAFQQRQHNLGFGIAETAVILNDLRTIGSQHQTEIQATLEGAALSIHCLDGGQEDSFHALLGNSIGVIGVGGNSTHTAGIQTSIIVACTLVVHRRNHGNYHITVSKGQHRDLRTGQEFLNNDLITAGTEYLVGHHRANSLHSLLTGHSDDNTLAQSQTVSLDNSGDGSRFQILQRCFHIGEDFISSSGNTVLLHEVLGENLTALNDCSICLGAKARDTLLFQCIHAAQNQGIIGCNNGIVNAGLHSKINDGINVLCTDVYTGSILCHTAVTGCYKDFGDGLVFFQFFNNGMLTATAANNE